MKRELKKIKYLIINSKCYVITYYFFEGKMLYLVRNIVPLAGPVKRDGSGAWIRTTVRGSKGPCPATRRPPKTDLSSKREQILFYQTMLL
jgi:hypothetical protein